MAVPPLVDFLLFQRKTLTHIKKYTAGEAIIPFYGSETQ